jgi:nicotinate-nucleotide adenylyltransferase
MAEIAKEKLELDIVLIMPATDPPHKADVPISSFDTRCEMAAALASNIEGVEMSRFEESIAGPSFTADTLSAYHRDHRDDVYFIIGADSLRDLESWREPERVLSACTLVVFPRGDLTPANPLGGPMSLVVMGDRVPDVSSRSIRDHIGAGESVSDMVSPTVHSVIERHRLYRAL